MNKQPRERPLITIAIVTFNRADLLARSLGSLCELESSSDYDIEVLVVDNASTDETSFVVESFATRLCGIRRVYEPTPGLPFARSRAVKEARGDWIAFFDDDQLAASNWLKTLFETTKDLDVEVVGGSRSLLVEASPIPPLPPYTRTLLGEIASKEQRDYHFLSLPCTGNVLISKAVFDRVGLFNETALDGGEDTEFFYRVLQAGIRSVYNPKARVEHIIAPRRLEKGYLMLIAHRHGRHVCRRDLAIRGTVMSIASALMRLVWTGIPNYLAALAWRALGQSDRAICSMCKLQRVFGYWSFLAWTLRKSPVTDVKTTHRGKG